MSRFQLCEYKRVIVAGEIHVHARLKAIRDDRWNVVGVFQLHIEEWDELTELCELYEIPVTAGDEENILPA